MIVQHSDFLKYEDTVREAIIHGVPALIYVVSADGHYLGVNSHWVRLFNVANQDLIGKTIFDTFPEKYSAAFHQNNQTVLKARKPLEFIEVAPNGHTDHTYLTLKIPLFDDHNEPFAVCGISTDITTQTGQVEVLERLIRGDKLEEILHLLACMVEQLAPDAVASISLLDDTGRLCYGAAPSLPDEYNRAIDGIPIHPDVGTCCAAAARAEIVITPDIATDPGWQTIRHLALGLGLKAAWSMPILSGRGKVLGTLGTYFREIREPSDHERRTVALFTRTAAVAIERKRAEDLLRKHQAQLQSTVGQLETSRIELSEKVRDLEKFYDVAVDREHKLMALENEIRELRAENARLKSGTTPSA